MPAADPNSPVYQLRVTLQDVRPPVWRRFQVRSDTTLYKLHQILQVVMGWTNSHLHLFTIAGKDYGEPDPEFEMDIASERRVRLFQLITRPRSKFTYEYDFGDSWEHDLVLEHILPADPAVRYPVCLAGARACPPEDCGGAPGYAELLEALRDPQHEEHDELLEWVGGSFDPEAFDLAIVNRGLRRIR